MKVMSHNTAYPLIQMQDENERKNGKTSRCSDCAFASKMGVGGENTF